MEISLSLSLYPSSYLFSYCTFVSLGSLVHPRAAHSISSPFMLIAILLDVGAESFDGFISHLRRFTFISILFSFAGNELQMVAIRVHFKDLKIVCICGNVL